MAAKTQDTQTRIGVFSVRNRLLAVVILAVIVPVAITQYVGVATSRSALEKNIDETLHNAATSAAQSMAQVIGAQLDLLTALANEPALQLAAVQQNGTYTGSAQQDLQTLEARDTEWTAAVAAGNTDIPLIQAVVTGPMSDRLRHFGQRFPAHVEVFMTDAHGAVLASSDPTSDYNQADEAWWQKAWNDGKGANFVGNEVTYDESSKTYSVNMAVPLALADGKVVGVLRTTYNIAALQANIGGVKFGKTGHAVLVNNQGQVLVSPTGHATAATKTLAGLVPLLAQPQSSTDGKLDVTPDENGNRSVVSLAPVGTRGAFPAIDQLGWSVAAFQGESGALAPVNSAVNAVLVAAVVVLILGVSVAYGLSRTLTVPLRRLTEAAQHLVQTSDWSIRVPVRGRSEFTVLAQTFNALTTDLEKLIGTLEARVQARTRDLQLATQVSGQISTILDPAQLLPQVVELTKERFGLYHAHIYLVDGTGHRLVLAAGAGEAGRRMMEQGHRIASRAERSLVARAARDNHAIVVDDVTQDPNFLENPVLPNTRSEAALPLSVGNRVLGVLDVQSEQVSRFDADILPVLSTLAGQIAVAVQNARLFEQTQSSQQLLQTIIDTTPDWIFTKDQDYRYMLVNRAFAEYYGKRTPEEMVGKDDYDLGTPAELIEGDPEKGIVGFRTDDRAVVEGGEAIHNPYDVVNYADGTQHIFDTSKLPLRDAEGRIIGVLGVSHDVTERLKAEEEASRRAAEMQTVAEVGAEVTSLLDPEQLLWNVATLTKERFGLYHAHIYLLDDAGRNLVLTAGAGEVGRMMVETGFTIPGTNQRSVVARAAQGRRAVIVNNVLRVPDFLPNPMLPGTKSEMAVPMIAGDRVVGVLDVQADQADHFTEEDTRLMTILAAQIAIAVQNARQFEQTQSSQHLLRTLIDNLPDLVYVKDIEGRKLLSNKLDARFMGVEDPDEVIGKTDFDFYPPEQAAQFHADDMKVISGEPIINHEEAFSVDGEPHWLLTTKVPLRDGRGRPIGLVGIGHDVTERVKAEQGRIEREQLLRTVIDNLPDLVYAKDTQGRKLLANKLDAHFMGMEDPDEVIGKTDFDFYPKEQAELFFADDMRVIQSGEPVLNREEAFSVGGEAHWLLTTKVPLRDAEGRIIGLVGIGHDVTERLKVEEEVRRRAAEMQTVAEVGAEVTSLLDPEQLLWNVATLTKERFGLYHAHIYLLDDAGENLVLTAGAGEVGRMMVETGFTIPGTNQRSVVARAAQGRRAVIVNNVLRVPDFLPNPMLPGTKSEMAVPMIAGDRVVGVLDVQADQADHFTEEDTRLMTILAAQIAIAVQNARQFEQTQSSQHLLRLLIDNLPDHIYVKDRQGRFTIRNRAGARHMGAASPEEVVGKTDFDYYPRELAEIYYAAEQAIIESGEPLIDQEEPIEDAEGRRGWILTTKMPLRNRQGEIIGLVGIGHDITTLKRTEQELLEREQLLRTLIDSMPDLVYVKDTESRYILSNVAHAQFMGFASPDEAVGRTVFDVYPPDLAPQYYADDRSVIETGQPVEREEINVDSVGNRRWSWVTKVPLQDSLGRVVGLVGVARDITERKRSEETIRRYADEMETVAEVGTEAATSLEPDKLLQSVSDLTKERFGLYHAHIYLMDDAGKNLVLSAGTGQAGQVMVSAGHRIVVSHAHSLVARAARSRQPVIVNNVTQAPDFLPNPLLPATKAEMAVPMIVGDRVIGVLDVQSDEVDRFVEEDMRLMTILAAQIAVSVQNAELYAEQVEVADRLREVDRLKSEFLASMSHELRTPLNSIIGYAEVLLDGIDGELTNDMTEDIGAIHGSGKHLLNLINDILDLAKIEARQMDLVTENLSLRPLAEDMVNTSRVLLKDKSVDLVLDLADDLPDLHADSLRLRQIINNLLTNAIKFTEEGSIVMRAGVYDADPRMVTISITDTGIGIKEEHLPVIFDRFRQVDQSHTRRASGTGLGLSITRQLVEMHGGSIWAESEPGVGSTFSFTIPVAVEESIKA